MERHGADVAGAEHGPAGGVPSCRSVVVACVACGMVRRSVTPDTANGVREQLNAVLSDFTRIPGVCETSHWQDIVFEFSDAPHSRPRPLEANQQAVYLFFRGEDWLRVGQTSHPARFVSQHYATGRSGSNFAKDIWNNRREFGFRGSEQEVGIWIMENCGRANVRMPVGWPKEVGRLLESYLHYRLRPRFEGRRAPAAAGRRA